MKRGAENLRLFQMLTRTNNISHPNRSVNCLGRTPYVCIHAHGFRLFERIMAPRKRKNCRGRAFFSEDSSGFMRRGRVLTKESRCVIIKSIQWLEGRWLVRRQERFFEALLFKRQRESAKFQTCESPEFLIALAIFFC